MEDGILKRKIFNDPVYGFISIPNKLIFELIEHPWFQRLRRISQLGLSTLVYTGANHTRFPHAIGATYLMRQAIKSIRSKGFEITPKEEEGALVAILLHDIGHGPFSHALENSIATGVSHEAISLIFMNKLNNEFNGKLTLGIQIFKNKYPKKFLHQLVSSQLDMDRLDYLKRDSFFSGVSEGVISSDRIVKMLTVHNDELAVEAKGIYSIENFIVSRRLMYWQVYLHKTVISAEYILVKILKRAKELANQGVPLFATPAFELMLKGSFTKVDFETNETVFTQFSNLDDFDVMTSIKAWTNHSDKILSFLCTRLISRKLNKIEIQSEPFSSELVTAKKEAVIKKYGFTLKEAGYLVYSHSITNNAYDVEEDKINIVYKNGMVKDIAEAADLLNISVLSKSVEKHFLSYPKGK